MSKDKEHSTDERIMYIPQNFGSDGDLFGIFSESIETRVKYPDNSMTTVYLCVGPVIYLQYMYYSIQKFFTVENFLPSDFQST